MKAPQRLSDIDFVKVESCDPELEKITIAALSCRVKDPNLRAEIRYQYRYRFELLLLLLEDEETVNKLIFEIPEIEWAYKDPRLLSVVLTFFDFDRSFLMWLLEKSSRDEKPECVIVVEKEIARRDCYEDNKKRFEL